MPDIRHSLTVNAPHDRVFEAFVTPAGLDTWWTLRAAGSARVGATWSFYFGDAYDWRGELIAIDPGRFIEWRMTNSDNDWAGTTVGATLTRVGDVTRVEFWHCGWREANDHYHTSDACWEIYLHLMKRWVETGEVVPYARRLNT